MFLKFTLRDIQVPRCVLTLSTLGNFACFFCRLLVFTKIIFFSVKSFRNTIRMSTSLDPDQAHHFVKPKLLFFSVKSFRKTIRMSTSLDPDQAHHFVKPDLGPNCLQKLSADDTSRQRVNMLLFCPGNSDEKIFLDVHAISTCLSCLSPDVLQLSFMAQ